MSLSWPARLAAFYFAYFAYTAAFMAYFPPYLASRGLDAAAIALVLSLPQFARIFAPAAWGWIADRTGARRAIVSFSCAVLALAFAGLPWVDGPIALALAVGAMSVLSAGALPIVETLALAALAAEPGRYGPIRLWGSVGFILVVLAGGAWLDWRPIGQLPGLLAGLATLAFAASLFLPDAHPAPRAAEAPVPSAMGAGAALIGAGFCMACAHGVLYAFLTLHLQRLGYSGTAIGFLWTLGVLAEIFVFLYLPGLFRRHALSSIMLASLAIGVLRFLLVGWAAQWAAWLVFAQLLHAATFGAFHAASIAAVQRVFPARAHARGQALFSSLAYGAGGAAGSLAGGWAWQAGGAGMAFSAAAAAALAGVVFAWPLRRAGL